MRTKRTSIRQRQALALAGVTLIVAAVAGSAAQAGASQSSQTIKSGAGPGWPKTLHPSDFVRRIDNPWFPLRPGTVYRYRGIKDGQPSREVLTVTSRTKVIQHVREKFACRKCFVRHPAAGAVPSHLARPRRP